MKAYLITSGSLFTLIALFHVARLLQHWPAVVAAWAVPVWASGLGLIVAGSLALWAFRLAWRRSSAP
jgi:hypothetical protein